MGILTYCGTYSAESLVNRVRACCGVLYFMLPFVTHYSNAFMYTLVEALVSIKGAKNVSSNMAVIGKKVRVLNTTWFNMRPRPLYSSAPYGWGTRGLHSFSRATKFCRQWPCSKLSHEERCRECPGRICRERDKRARKKHFLEVRKREYYIVTVKYERHPE